MESTADEVQELLPLKFWEWYAVTQTRLCSVHRHGQMSAHTVAELAKCAVAKGIITLDEVPKDFLERAKQ